MHYRIVTASRSSAIGEGLTYESDLDIEPGSLVSVPLRGSTVEGIVLERMQETVEGFDTKNIAGVLSTHPVLPKDLLATLPWMQETYLTNMRGILKSVLPAPPWKNLLSKEAAKTRSIIIKKNDDQLLSREDNLPLLLMGSQALRRRMIIRELQDTLEREKDVIVLAPDFAACEEWKEFLSLYVDASSVIQLAGATTAAQRKACRRMHAGERLVVIGTRSAVFAPVHHLGLIVMDEEQEWTYKNRQTPYVHTRECALQRAHHAAAHLIFGSACPSLETWKRVQQGTIRLHEPEHENPAGIHLVDLKDAVFGTSYPLTSPLIEAMQKRLERHEQSVLLLNHRGVASGVICTECRYRLESNDAQPLTLHEDARGTPFLWNHIAGTMEPMPDHCPQCGSVSLRPIGAGTQGAEILLKKFFPQANIQRVDSETIDSKESLLDVRALMERKEVDILIGTQPVVSLASAPSVTLLAVLVADIGLSAPTVRASERTVGLLARMRSMNPEAEMFIQTFQPESLEMQALESGKLDTYLSHELALRKRGGFPPEARVISLICRGIEAKKNALNVKIQLEDLMKKYPDMVGTLTMQPSFSSKNVWTVTLRGKDPAILVRMIDAKKVAIDVEPLDF